MFGFYLNPGHDELLFSLVARHAAAIGHDSCFPRDGGYRPTILGSQIPNRLNALASQWRPVRPDPNELLQNHTLYPYLARFAPPARAESLRQWMLTGEGKRPTMLGVMAELLRPAASLRLCLACVERDLKSGTPHWKRRHQLPGAAICLDHRAALRDSGVIPHRQDAGTTLAPLTVAIARQARSLEIAPSDIAALKNFSELNEVCLTASAEAVNVERLGRLLVNLLLPYRTGGPSTPLRTERLADRFLGHEPARIIFRILNADITARQCIAAWQALASRRLCTKHPLFVMLALDFLGASATDLADASSTPWTRAPTRTPEALYPCGFPSCERYRGPPGAELHKMPSAQRIYAECPLCGFTYRWSRQGRGISQFIAGGPKWESTLNELMRSSSLSQKAIAARLGVANTTMKRHAICLALRSPAPPASGERPSSSCTDPSPSHKIGARQTRKTSNRNIHMVLLDRT